MIVLEFEKRIFEIESKIKELRHLNSNNLNVSDEVKKLEQKLEKALKELYKSLSPWEKVQIARHPERPQCIDYVNKIVTDFFPLAGDRQFGEDSAILAGIGRINGEPVVIIGHNKGKEAEERVSNHFGMPMPEGYRKAIRILELADKFSLPVITFIDTPGAFPGIEAEERGQAQAIAASIEKSFNVNVPIISVVIGEGGSGGAIAIGVSDVVLMLENSIYSVISPEGCAAILWKSSDQAQAAANVLKLTAEDLLKMGIIDEIITEPIGGAHRMPDQMITSLQSVIAKYLSKLKNANNLAKHRKSKFLKIGLL